MLVDVLTKHLSSARQGCVVNGWLSGLTKEEREAFEKIKEQSTSINVVILYKDLSENAELPFKLTAFRSHLRGYCTCPK
jgi:hypothetical protein